ncbi:MAG: type VI secretion system baseplate subunit TssG [Holosporales bacterium]|jgi:type VI secretion system protein ImpH|nr:type VI secretion system baseplate subunit TssG [Holosporales bacterium]
MQTKRNIPLIKDLFKNTQQYEFVKVVQLLKSFARAQKELGAENHADFNLHTHSQKDFGVGKHVDSSLYFRSSVLYKVPNADVSAIEIHGDLPPTLAAPQKTGIPDANQLPQLASFRFTVWTNFLGIAGIQGPLPLVYTERVFRSSRSGNKAFAAFLDIFNNRLISLLYEISCHTPGISPWTPDKSDIGQILQAFGGITAEDVPSHKKNFGQVSRRASSELSNQSPKQQNCDINESINFQRLCVYSIMYKSLFWKRTRATQSLKQMLQHFLKTRVQITEFLGAFFELGPQDITRLGENNGNLFTLGKDTALGNRAWRQSSIIHIAIMEENLHEYQKLNPHKMTAKLRNLLHLCRMYVPVFIRCKFFAAISPSSKKQLVLGKELFLGFDTWLGTKPLEGKLELARFIRI